MGGCLLVFLVAVIAYLLFRIQSHKKEIHNIESNFQKQIDRKEEIIALLRYDMAKLCAFTRYHISQESQEEFRFYYEIYGAADFDIPNDVYFINHYVPVKGTISEAQPYGEYTVYIPNKGDCYHSSKTCSSSFNQPVHIYDIAGRYHPCPKCATMILYSPPEWYQEIKRIMDNNKKK